MVTKDDNETEKQREIERERGRHYDDGRKRRMQRKRYRS